MSHVKRCLMNVILLYELDRVNKIISHDTKKKKRPAGFGFAIIREFQLVVILLDF